MEDAHTNFLCPNNDAFYALKLYKPLDPEKLEIRLFELQPGSYDSPIQCTLVQPIDLSTSKLEYRALSYVAGSPYTVECVRFDGWDFNVFRPIALALKRIRQLHEALYIWVDQLCINQSNVAERDRQVSLMGHIYSNATETIAWMGEKYTAEMAAAFAFARRVVKIRDERFRYLEEKHFGEPIFETDSPYVLLAAARELLSNVETAEVEAFQCLARRRWWRRCWILQEATLPVHVTLLTQTDALHLDDSDVTYLIVKQLRDLVIRHEPETQEERERFSALRRNLKVDVRRMAEISKLRKIHKGVELDLLGTLQVSRYCDASDPRDHVYAMLGLVKNSHRLKPSYEAANSIERVLTEAAKAIIEEDGRLDVLGCVSKWNPDATLHLPSWVPNFSEKLDYELTIIERAPVPYRNKIGYPVLVPRPNFPKCGDSSVLTFLRCWMIPFGPVAAEDTLGVVGNAELREPSSLDGILADWRGRMSAAGQSEVYALTKEPLESEFQAALRHGHAAISPLPVVETSNSSSQPFADYSKAHLSHSRFRTTVSSNDWRFFASPEGFIGVVPAATQHDDVLAILFEARMPFVLRKSGTEKDRYVLIGTAHIHGIRPSFEIKEVYKNRSRWQDRLQEIWIH